MEWFDGLIAIGFGFLIRIGIPVVITILLVRALRRLDERWQDEAQAETQPVSNIGCWEIHNCSHAERETCVAYLNPDRPCWQMIKETYGTLKDDCTDCEVFLSSPLPASITISR